MRYAVEFGANSWQWTLAFGVAGATAYHLWRSHAAAWLKALRAGGALALILALLQPALVRKTAQLAKPKLLIFVDQSHSWGGTAGRGSRLVAAAKGLLEHKALIE